MKRKDNPEQTLSDQPLGRLSSLTRACRAREGAGGLYLDGLGYVHLVNFDLWKAASGHIFVLLLVAIKKVSGIDAHADGPLGQKSKQSAAAVVFVERKNTPRFSSWRVQGPTVSVLAQTRQSTPDF